MKIKINLGANTQATTEWDEPVLLPENELILAFESDVYRLYSLLLSVKNDTKKKQYKLTQNSIDIAEFLEPGVVDMEISMVSKGEIVKTWRCPRIIIKEHQATFELTPEIAELRQGIEDTKTAIKELFTLLKNQNLI